MAATLRKWRSAPKVVRDLARRHGLRSTLWHGVRRVATSGGRTVAGPRTLHLMPLQFLCNHVCPMCDLQDFEPDVLRRNQRTDLEQGLKLADYERLFDQMLPGLRMVSLFGGGEPLAHPEIEGILRAIKARGWTGAMITNGSLLREKLARLMIDAGWENLRISAHAGDAATYRVIHGRNNFDRVRENLLRWDSLRKATPSNRPSELAMHHVIQRENLGGIEAMFEFAHEVGVDSLSFLPIIPYREGQELTRGELEFARAALASASTASSIPVWLDPLLRAHESVLPRRRVPGELETTSASEPTPAPTSALEAELASASESERQPETPSPEPSEAFRPATRCSVGYDYAVVSAFGDVTPCCHSDEVMGNLRQQSFREVWNGVPYREFRRRLMGGEFAPYCASKRCSIEEVLHR